MTAPHDNGLRDNGLVIVADQVEELGGTERVLEAILRRYSAAPLLAPGFSTTNLPRSHPLPWRGRVTRVGMHGPRRHFLAPLYARRLASGPIEPARVVLSLAHAGWAMAARVPPGARHVCYNAGPPRWLYDHTRHYLRTYPSLLRPALRAAVPALRADHRRLMHRPDRVITNSRFSASRIEHLFGISPEVIHPPVRTDFFTPGPRRRRHLLTVARLVPHKRVDLVVEAFRGIPHRLVVAGAGPWSDRLRDRAAPNVTFTGYVEDAELRELYRSSIALICPSIEEFGIVMAEAQAAGTPVIAPRVGGALEIVRDGLTGILLDRVDPRSIAAAVRVVVDVAFDQLTCRESAERFAESHFVSALERVVNEESALSGAAPARRTPQQATSAGIARAA